MINEREGFDAQQEAKREAAGATSPQSRARIWDGLTRYLGAEVRHARKAAAAEKEDRDRRSS